MTKRSRWFRWGILFILLNGAFVWLLLINHVFALWSEPGCNGVFGASCKHMSVMLAPNGPIPQSLGDAGDAPDSSPQAPMVAYTSPTTITAAFPTIYEPGNAPGPYHFNPEAGAYLGQAVSKEINAHQLPDHDGLTNINPPLDRADDDKQDDSLGWIDGLEDPCDTITLTYTVTVEAENTPFYLNMWFDFNRDGAWGNGSVCTGGGGNEWAVQNHIVNPGGFTGLIIGTISITTGFYGTEQYDPLWLRVTLSEQPMTMVDGSGPPEGFLYGETEDYFLCLRHTAHSGCETGDPIAGWRG